MFIVAALTSPTLGNAIDGHFLHWLAVQLVLQLKINWSVPSTVLRNELMPGTGQTFLVAFKVKKSIFATNSKKKHSAGLNL